MIPGLSDTSPEAERGLIEGYRRMSPTQKLKRVASLNRALSTLAAARIRAQYGDVPDGEMRLRLGALRLGRETMVKVFGWDPRRRAGKAIRLPAECRVCLEKRSLQNLSRSA